MTHKLPAALAAYRSSIYTGTFPTGTWVEVKGLALPEFMIEIELEAAPVAVRKPGQAGWVSRRPVAA